MGDRIVVPAVNSLHYLWGRRRWFLHVACLMSFQLLLCSNEKFQKSVEIQKMLRADVTNLFKATVFKLYTAELGSLKLLYSLCSRHVSAQSHRCPKLKARDASFPLSDFVPLKTKNKKVTR